MEKLESRAQKEQEFLKRYGKVLKENPGIKTTVNRFSFEYRNRRDSLLGVLSKLVEEKEGTEPDYFQTKPNGHLKEKVLSICNGRASWVDWEKLNHLAEKHGGKLPLNAILRYVSSNIPKDKIDILLKEKKLESGPYNFGKIGMKTREELKKLLSSKNPGEKLKEIRGSRLWGILKNAGVEKPEESVEEIRRSLESSLNLPPGLELSIKPIVHTMKNQLVRYNGGEIGVELNGIYLGSATVTDIHHINGKRLLTIEELQEHAPIGFAGIGYDKWGSLLLDHLKERAREMGLDGVLYKIPQGADKLLSAGNTRFKQFYDKLPKKNGFDGPKDISAVIPESAGKQTTQPPYRLKGFIYLFD